MKARPAVNRAVVFMLISLLISVSFCCGQRQPREQATQAAGAWKVLGPGGGGSQFEPTINPSDPNHVFVRCDMTGAYVTENGGQSWRMFNLRTVVQDFEFDPGNPSVVYACNTGLYRSEDRGKLWSLVYPAPEKVTAERMMGDHASQGFETVDGMPDGSISKVRVDPANSNRLYLALSGSRQSGGSATMMFSSDRGASWKALGELTGRRILGIFPGAWDNQPDQVTVLTESGCAIVSVTTGETSFISYPVGNPVLEADGGRNNSGSVLYILTAMRQEKNTVTGGILRTADRGKTWEQANGGLLEGWSATGRLPSFRTIAVCERQPENVYLSCNSYEVMMSGYPQRQSGIIKTTDRGQNWKWVLTICGGEVLTGNFTGGWLKRTLGWFGNPSFLGVCPTNPNICYATDSGRTFRTTDGGATWVQVISEDFPDGSAASRGLDVTTCYGVHFDPYNKDHFFITYTDIGLFHTFDGGKTWSASITGIPRQWRNTCYWLAFDPAVKGRIWSVWSNVHDLPRPKMFRSGNLVNGNQEGGVAVSGDGGRWWELCHKGVFIDGEYRRGMPLSAVCTHILIDPNSPVSSRTLYVCDLSKGVYKSADAGRTWELKNQGLGPNFNAWRMVLLPSGRLILLIARGGIEGREMIDGGLYFSDNGADSWQPLALPQGVNAPNDLVFDPTDPQRMYLSCWPWTREGAEHCGGLLRTDDGGKSWRQVFDEKAQVYAAAVDPHNPSTVYINTFNSAAFGSDDRGETWYRLQGYNFKWGHRPVPDPYNPGMLYLTSFGGSVFYGPSKGVPGATEDIVNLPARSWKAEWKK